MSANGMHEAATRATQARGRAVPAAVGDRLLVVAPDGDDAGPGTRAAPLATLDEAQRRLRTVPGGTVELTDGTWQLDRPFRLTARDSGEPGAPKRWTAAPGAHPVLSGGVVVRDWAVHDAAARIFRAPVPGIRDTRQVSIDGVLAERSWVALGRDQVEVTEEGLALRDPALAGLVALTGHERIEVVCVASFTHRYAPVARIERDRIVMQQPAWRNNCWGWDTLADPIEGGALRLVNAVELLQPGQWYLDPARAELLYRAAEGDHPDAHRFVVPRLESLLQIAGTVDEPVHDLQLRGLEFAHTSWLGPSGPAGYASQQAGTFLGRAFDQPPDYLRTCQRSCPEFEATRNDWEQLPAAVQVSAAARVDLVANTFTQLGQVGLGLGNDAGAHGAGVGLAVADVLVHHNLFTQLSGGAVVVGGIGPDAHHPADPRRTVRDVVIDNNLVTAVAVDYMDMPGIVSTYVDGVTITHNEVSDLPYDGIDVGFGWGANDPGGSPEYRARGLYASQPVYETPTTLRDAVVAGNLVHATKQQFTDGGAIYTLSANPGARVVENYLRDNNRSVGLYLDEGSRFVVAERNVVQDAPVWVFTNTYGDNHTDDNVVARNWYNGGRTHTPEPGAHRNSLVDNVLVAGYDWPLAAQRVMSAAGLEPPYRTFARATTPMPFGAALEAYALEADGVEADALGPGRRRLRLAVEGFGDEPVTGLRVTAVQAPPGWSLRPTAPLPDAVRAGGRVGAQWLVEPRPTPPTPAMPAGAPPDRIVVTVEAVVDGLRHELAAGVTLG
ncbi:right-handed parallel beta-helix repeat-containing protein [Pengzhenrongella sicca]|uniref:Right-handed parallel beta-helix repeat-containing protein n=1 Tax=Pengzhenrongella sicca TaxID=2819238 RepID=A0A8A4ZI75_9MICO|nr:right-handed parallel beta-helix repeat-containing protein [Pengzhenrongella sicca]QTE30965.1 right-handed parallel beta-helix repeat-containing protein [Pengzhenrongella sicca]